MADVAREAGVSTATVSRALRGLPGVGTATRARIEQAAARLSYVVSPEASGLSRGTTGRVAVVVPSLRPWFYASMLASIEAGLARAGVDVLVYQVDGADQRRRFFEELPARRKVDALVLVALPLREDEIDRLDLMGVQVIVAGGALVDHPHVRADDHAIALAAVRHLIGLGHTRIAMIRTWDTDGAHWSSDSERTRGFRDALAETGLGVEEGLVVAVPPGPLAGRDGVRRLLARGCPPTAIFGYSDEIAIAAVRGLQVAGIRVPEDVSVIGVDGHPLSELFDLTTVCQSVTQQGRITADLVLTALGGRPGERDGLRSRLVPHRLIERGSTAEPGG